MWYWFYTFHQIFTPISVQRFPRVPLVAKWRCVPQTGSMLHESFRSQVVSDLCKLFCATSNSRRQLKRIWRLGCRDSEKEFLPGWLFERGTFGWRSDKVSEAIVETVGTRRVPSRSVVDNPWHSFRKCLRTFLGTNSASLVLNDKTIRAGYYVGCGERLFHSWCSCEKKILFTERYFFNTWCTVRSVVVYCTSYVARKNNSNVCGRRESVETKVHQTPTDAWSKWVSDLPSPPRLKITLCIIPFTKRSNCPYIVFQMGQRIGMAQFHTGDCSFMFAKPRLTPIKSVSVPPPELVAACLAVQIDASNHCGVDCQCCIFVFWRDSTSVLQMVHGTSTRYPVFL